MNKTLIFSAAVVLVLGGGIATSYFSAWSNGNRQEQQLKASYADLKNQLAQYGNKLAETAQVPDMYRDDVIAVATAAIEGRYGENGSRAVFQMLQEQNPQIDSALYVQIQQVIESGRTDFAIAQTKFLDVRRVYETSLGSPWTGTWMRIAGYPTITLADYDIVTSVRAEDAFKTKTEEPIKLR